MLRRVAVPATAAAAALALAACGAGVPQDPTGFLLKAPSVTPVFPLTATYLPRGLARPAFVSFDDPGVNDPGVNDPGVDDTVRDTGVTALFKPWESSENVDDNYGGVSIEVHTGPDHLDPRARLTELSDDTGTVTEVRVGGQQAWLLVYGYDPADKALAWLRAPQQLVTVDGPFSAKTLIRVAEGLRTRLEPGRVDFAVAVAPAGFHPSGFGTQEITLSPRHATEDNKVLVKAEDSDPDPNSDDHDSDTTSEGGGRQFTVGKRSGWLRTEDGRFQLTLHLKETYWLVIDTPTNGGWNEEELRRFAAGVRYIGPEPPSPPQRA